MSWMVFVAGAVLSWGMYGVILHRGQAMLGSPLRALLCVGLAYVAIGVIVPIVGLAARGELNSFGASGVMMATLAGAFGALGAVCVIWAFRSGGLPIYVMPLVFAGAPLVNALVSTALNPARQAAHPLLYVGFVLAALGAGLVLRYRP